MNNKQFGGNYISTHAEINLLFKLKILNSYTSKYGLISNKNKQKNKFKSLQIRNKKFNRKSIRKYRKSSPKCIYVIRVGEKGKLMYSRPCNHCLIVLKQIGIKYVIYSATKKTFIKEQL
eukprot:81493_1